MARLIISRNFLSDGLVVLENNQWYYFNNEKYLKEHTEDNKVDFDYDYTPGKLTQHWKLFSELF